MNAINYFKNFDEKEDQSRIGHDVDVRGTGDLDINDHVFIGRGPHVSS
jgi:hypothetical protein